MSDLQRWVPDRDVNMERVLTEWDDEIDGEWVRAEDAIRREAELLAQIRNLEARAAQSAALVAKAMELIAPKSAD